MVYLVASKVVNALIESKLITKCQKEEYEYAFVCEIESFIVIGSIIIISIILQNFIQTVFFLIYFLSLRKRAGGYHSNSFVGCYIGTISIYLTVYVVAKEIGNNMYLYMLSAIAFIAVTIIGAVNHPNMNFSRYEYIGAKKSSRLTLYCELLIIVLMLVVKVDRGIIVYSLMGIDVSALFLIIAKILRQEVNCIGKENGDTKIT